MKNLKIIICVFLLACLVGVACACEEKPADENLIILQEKIIILKAISFEGSAGGIGSVSQVKASNISQFLSLIGDEKVFATINHREDIDSSLCKYQKSYWARVEERIVVYEKTYYRPGYKIPDYDEYEVYFQFLYSRA